MRNGESRCETKRRSNTEVRTTRDLDGNERERHAGSVPLPQPKGAGGLQRTLRGKARRAIGATNAEQGCADTKRPKRRG